MSEKLQIPPAITKTVVTTTTKTKVIGFDDYNTDIRSSDSSITIEAGITAVEFAGKEVALKSVLKLFSEFYSETKHKSLPGKEGGGTTVDEKDAIKRHLVHARLKQREEVRALSMERNEDPNTLC